MATNGLVADTLPNNHLASVNESKVPF